MSDAAGPGADALFNRFVCRVSGAPADTVDGMRPERTLAVLRQLEDTERRLHAAREDVSQLLFAAIGAAQEKPRRNKLITLKRELYNLKPQPPSGWTRRWRGWTPPPWTPSAPLRPTWSARAGWRASCGRRTRRRRRSCAAAFAGCFRTRTSARG